jgi:uncharacterized protein (TIGR02145 family)
MKIPKTILLCIVFVSFFSFAQTENNIKSSVTIGTQVWEAENLNVSAFRNGDIIPEAKSPEEWTKAGNDNKPAWCYYNRDGTNDAKYGKLYNWYAVHDARGLAPVGWHIPSDDEWTILGNSLGGDSIAGYKMKSTIGWDENGNGDNSSGFIALPGGTRTNSGGFYYTGSYGYFWSCTGYDGGRAGCRYLNFNFSLLHRANFSTGCGFSVRCVKD